MTACTARSTASTAQHSVRSRENPTYIYSENGTLPMKEIAPTGEEIAAGLTIKSSHLSKRAAAPPVGPRRRAARSHRPVRPAQVCRRRLARPPHHPPPRRRDAVVGDASMTRPSGRSTFLGVDTLVIVGAWSEDCVAATAFDAVDKYNLDTVVVEDAIGET